MKTTNVLSPHCLSDRELLARIRDLAGHERRATASLVAHLAELDERRLYLAEGCSCLFAYCTEVLNLSEHAAINRIEAARAARKFPVVLEKLADGSVHLAAVRVLAPHLTNENHAELLAFATYKTKRQVEEIVARIRPTPPVDASIRKLPAPGISAAEQTPALSLALSTPAGSALSSVVIAQADPGTPAESRVESVSTGDSPLRPEANRRARLTPCGPDLYNVQFAADAETHQLLRQAQELLRHQIPNGDVAAVLGLALEVLVEKLQKQKFGARTPRPRQVEPVDATTAEPPPGISTRPPGAKPMSRHIPAAVRREVWKRDAGQCAFTAHSGRRCTERGRLEFHHVEAFARGGPATVDNIELRCRAHNVYEAELTFGFADHKFQLAPGRPEAGSAHCISSA